MPEKHGELVSPQQMLDAAIEIMLDGQKPSTERDWAKIVNFMALNIAKGLEEPACRLLKYIFDIPLSDSYIEAICNHQLKIKERNLQNASAKERN